MKIIIANYWWLAKGGVVVQIEGMKHLTLMLTLFFSTLFASPAYAYADWEKVGNDTAGNTFYVDFERIRKVNGYVYYWELQSYKYPKETGILSNKIYVVKTYNQGDCEMFRLKALSVTKYSRPINEDVVWSSKTPSNPEWNYPIPNSVDEIMLKRVCKFAETL